MNRASRTARGLDGARERANVETFARGGPGRIRRAVLRILQAGRKRSRRGPPSG